MMLWMRFAKCKRAFAASELPASSGVAPSAVAICAVIGGNATSRALAGTAGA